MTEKASRKAADPPTGTVTFLFTDIEGSTSMWERNPVRMQGALARHDEILRTILTDRGGYVFKTVGDAFCVAFTTAKQAVEATLAAQRALFAEEWGENAAVRVRMALHTGATEERDGDYFGPPVNRVARLLSAGHGGQVLLSGVTYGLVRDNLGFLERGAQLRDLGEHRLKDLKHSERIYQLVVPDLPSEFPSLKTLDTRSDERYGLVRLIGSGGMAEVYLARDRELERDVALKVLKNRYADDEQFVERFKREAKSAASLSHPNIVAVHDRGETKDGAYYIVMEYVAGGTLKEYLLEEGSLYASKAAAVTLQVAQALQVAHERGVIHRDIKPHNILLTESGEVKVADFGIARATSSSVMTQEGAILGTAHYISPEQALGRPATPQSDLYSLGVVLYEMLTGEVPHDAETPIGIAMKHVSGELRSPKEANPDIPEEMNAVAVRLLACDPEDRYQSAVNLVEDLKRIEQGQPPAFAGEGNASSADVDVRAQSLSSSKQKLGEILPTPPPPTHPGDGRHRRWRGAPRWVLAVGLLGIVILLGAGILLAGQVFLGRPSPGRESSTPGYTLVKDNSGKLSMEVPSEWSAVDGTAWDFRGGKIGLSLIATTDLDAWYEYNYWRLNPTGVNEVPGVFFGVSKSLIADYPKDTENQVLGLKEFDYSDTCRYTGRYNYDDGIYAGKYDVWQNCGGTDAEVFVLAAVPTDRSYVVVIQTTATSTADFGARKHVYDTFKVANTI